MSLQVSKPKLLTIVLCAITVVGLILVIVGFVGNYISMSAEGETEVFKLSALSKDYNEIAKIDKAAAKEAFPGFGAMRAFAIITIIAICLTVVCAALNAVIDSKIIKYITLAVGAVTAVMAIIALITAFVFGSKVAKLENEGLEEALLKIRPAVGAWLLAIGGIVGGAATAVSAVKK